MKKHHKPRLATCSDKNFCCEPARKSHSLRHSINCRVWTQSFRRPADDDIGQGEGCEGGKCSIKVRQVEGN